MKKWYWLTMAVLILLSGCSTAKPAADSTGLTPAQRFSLLLTQGIGDLNRKEYENAIRRLDVAVSLRPDSQDAQNFLGIGYFMIENFKLARRQFEKVLSLNPSHAAALSNLGSVCLKENDWDNAEGMFRRVVALTPESATSLFSLGNVLLGRGKLEEGFAYLAKAIERDPQILEKNQPLATSVHENIFQNAEADFGYARLYAGLGNLEKTVEFLHRAKQAGFSDWIRIDQDPQFEKIRDLEEIRKFLESK